MSDESRDLADGVARRVGDPPYYEQRDVRMRGTLVGIALFFAGIAVCLLVSAGLYGGWKGQRGMAGPESSFRHGPDIVSDIERDWRAQTAAVKDHLENYGWVDRAGGWVRIPIERAMELSAQKSAQRPSPK